MPDGSRLHSDIPAVRNAPHITGHHQIQDQTAQQMPCRKPFFHILPFFRAPPPALHIPQQNRCQIYGEHAAQRQKNRGRQIPEGRFVRQRKRDLIKRLIDKCRQAVIPAVLHDHSDMRRQIRFIYGSACPSRLSVKQKHHTYTIQNNNCMQSRLTDFPILVLPVHFFLLLCTKPSKPCFDPSIITVQPSASLLWNPELLPFISFLSVLPPAALFKIHGTHFRPKYK